MRIALIGQAAFAEKMLSELHARGEEIVQVFAPPSPAGAKPDPLAAKASELGLPLSLPTSFKGEAAFEHFKTLDADLAILAFVTIIVPERIIYLPRYKSICFHPSLLPRHRGASSIAWAIIQGDRETGVTWFWPDKGIDTGPILIQRATPIDGDDTTASIYFNRLFQMGIETGLEAVELIKTGRAPALVQDESLATYEPPCRDPHGRIDFSKPAAEVYNLVRGCDPQPGAWAMVGEKKLRLYDARLIAGAGGDTAGEVVTIDPSGMTVSLAGKAALRAGRVRLDPDGKKTSPVDLIATGQLKVGMRLA